MVLDKVLVSSDNNPLYLDFWPIVSKVWSEKIGVEPVLLHICDEDSDLHRDQYGWIKKIKRVEGVDSGFQSQVVRMFGATYFPGEVCLISDIDMIPLSRNYFTGTVTGYPRESFVIYSSDAYHSKDRYPMCYNAALGSVFSEVLKLENNYHDFIMRLKRFGWGWDTDEYYLGKCINESAYPHIVKLKRKWPGNVARGRIDRIQWRYDDAGVSRGDYIDCHSLRPYNAHKEEVIRLVNLLLK